MIILPWRENFIKRNFIEFSFDNEDEDFIPDYNLFQSLNSSEQYYLAQFYNWDDGATVLQWIVESSICDKGTALLIFWYSEPDFYLNHNEDTIPDYEKDVFNLLKKIVGRFNKNDFKSSKFRFNPGSKVENIDWNKKYQNWDLPKSLKEEVKGITPISLGTLLLHYWEWQRKRRLSKREARKKRKK